MYWIYGVMRSDGVFVFFLIVCLLFPIKAPTQRCHGLLHSFPIALSPVHTVEAIPQR